jgi:hypothetical protein
MVMQRGSLADDSISAWAGHWQMRESLSGRGAVKLTSEYNFATGDESATRRHARHFRSALSDRPRQAGAGRSGGLAQHPPLREGVEFSPFKATPIAVNYHSWWLAEKTDGLYKRRRRAHRVRGGRRSQRSRRAGNRLPGDAGAHAAAAARGRLRAHVHRQVPRAGHTRASYSAPYVMATYVFLADK